MPRYLAEGTTRTTPRWCDCCCIVPSLGFDKSLLAAPDTCQSGIPFYFISAVLEGLEVFLKYKYVRILGCPNGSVQEALMSKSLILVLSDRYVLMLFMYARKSRGPKAIPCFKPKRTRDDLNETPSTRTVWERPDMDEGIH